MRTILLLPLFLVLTGCEGDAPNTKYDDYPPFQEMKLLRVEGSSNDQWEIWEDTVSKSRVLCHHSGSTGAYGGRSTSCVVVGVQPR